MKKLLIFLVVLLSLIADGVCGNIFCNISNHNGDDTRTIRQIRIDIFTIGGGKPRPRPRSLLPIIQAELDLTDNQLFLEFNETVGRVAITIKNSVGQVVSSYYCNTAIESLVVLGIVDTPDSYNICIEGDGIEASGYYDIMVI